MDLGTLRIYFHFTFSFRIWSFCSHVFCVSFSGALRCRSVRRIASCSGAEADGSGGPSPSQFSQDRVKQM